MRQLTSLTFLSSFEPYHHSMFRVIPTSMGKRETVPILSERPNASYQEAFAIEGDAEEGNHTISLYHAFGKQHVSYCFMANLITLTDNCLIICDDVKKLPTEYVSEKIKECLITFLLDAKKENTFVYKEENLPNVIKQSLLFL